jgi:hypothetical protein
MDDFVTRGIAEKIVDDLEPVDIDQDQGALTQLALLIDQMKHLAPLHESGQRI